MQKESFELRRKKLWGAKLSESANINKYIVYDSEKFDKISLAMFNRYKWIFQKGGRGNLILKRCGISSKLLEPKIYFILRPERFKLLLERNYFSEVNRNVYEDILKPNSIFIFLISNGAFRR